MNADDVLFLAFIIPVAGLVGLATWDEGSTPTTAGAPAVEVRVHCAAPEGWRTYTTTTKTIPSHSHRGWHFKTIEGLEVFASVCISEH